MDCFRIRAAHTTREREWYGELSTRGSRGDNTYLQTARHSFANDLIQSSAANV